MAASSMQNIFYFSKWQILEQLSDIFRTLVADPACCNLIVCARAWLIHVLTGACSIRYLGLSADTLAAKKTISVLLLLLLLLSLLLLLLLSLLQAWLLTPTCFHQNPSINCSIVDRRTKTPRNSLFLVFLWKVDLRRFWSLPWMIFFPADIGGWIFLLIFNRCWDCQHQFKFFLFGSH